MFQKIQNLIKKLAEKGQGVVEYALILGFVAVIAIYLLTGSNLRQNTEQNVKDASDIANRIHTQYNANSSNSSGT